MTAVLLVRRRIVLADDAFSEIVIWRVPQSVRPSGHDFKYRLAYVVDSQCVVRFDNEIGKGDHKHVGGVEAPYDFHSPDQLMADFRAEIARWNHGHGRS